MLERGTVVATGPGSVDVAIEPSGACETCAGGCTEGANGKRLLEGVADTLGARPGDMVEVHTPVFARRRAQRLVYVVPVVAVLFGYLAGFLLANWLGIAPDAVGAAFAIATGAASLVSLKRFERSFGRADGHPRVRAIIARGHSRSPGNPEYSDGPSHLSRRESTRE